MSPANRTLDRAFRLVLTIQGVLIGLLGLVGLVLVSVSAGESAHVLIFRVNLAHGVLLIVAGLGSVLVTRWYRAMLYWSLVQAAGFLGLYLFGSVVDAGGPMWSPTNRPASEDTVLALNTADHFLHLALAVIGVVILMGGAGPWLTGNRVPGRSPEAQRRDEGAGEVAADRRQTG